MQLRGVNTVNKKVNNEIHSYQYLCYSIKLILSYESGSLFPLRSKMLHCAKNNIPLGVLKTDAVGSETLY